MPTAHSLQRLVRSCRVAANDQFWGWTPTGGRPRSIMHQMRAKTLRIWVSDATLYNIVYVTSSIYGAINNGSYSILCHAQILYIIDYAQ